jgi:hypothetical protein
VNRRWYFVAATILAVATTSCGSSDGGRPPDGPFGHGGSPGATCHAGGPGQVFTNGDQFIRNAGPRARITSLSLADDHGIELLDSWIVPVTGNTLYGNWEGRPIARPRELPGVHWGERQGSVGASIPMASGNSVENIVLAVARAPGMREAWARGILVKYSSGGHDYSLLTATRIAIVARVPQCDALVQRITKA